MKYDPQIAVKWFAEHGIIAIPEYKFHPERKWRFDFVLIPAVHDGVHQYISDRDKFKLALEVQGGLFSGGRHSRGAALMKEHEKLNEAAVMGWRILYTIPQNLCMQETIDLIKRAL